jgi:hypothetical protein
VSRFNPFPVPVTVCSALVLWLVLASAGNCQTRVNVGNQPAEPATHFSYLFAAPAPYANAQGKVVYLCRVVLKGEGYARDVKVNFPGGAVDVMMNNCYSGGYLNGMTTLQPASNNWSFASSVPWNLESELTSSAELLYSAAYAAGTQPYAYASKFSIDDFTRAWREDATLYPNDGMLNYFGAAVSGKAAAGGIAQIVPDIYAGGKQWKLFAVQNQRTYSPLFVSSTNVDLSTNYVYGTNFVYGTNEIGVRGVDFTERELPFVAEENKAPVNPPAQVVLRNPSEYPQYASSGAGADSRTLLLPNPNLNKAKQYALLVVWGVTDPGNTFDGLPVKVSNNDLADAASTARIYQTLLAVFKVPADNIAVLYLNAAPGNTLGPFNQVSPGPDGAASENLPAFKVNGANTRANWTYALKGRYYTVNGTNAGGNLPGPNDRLFIFNTGHGSQVKEPGASKVYDTLSRTLSFDLQDSASPGAGFDPGNVIADAPTNDTVTIDFSGGADSGQPDVSALVQITTTTPLPDDVVISVDGLALGVAGGFLAAGSDTDYPLFELPNAEDDYDSEPTNALAMTYYQMAVPNSLLLTNGSISVTLSNLNPDVFDPNLVAGFIVRGGHQQDVYPVPAQTGLSLTGPQANGQSFFISWPAWLAPNGYQLLVNTNLATSNWVNAVSFYAGNTNLELYPNGATVPLLGNQAFFKLVPLP